MLGNLRDLDVRSGSLVASGDAEFGIVQDGGGSRLAVLAPAGSPDFEDFEGDYRGVVAGEDALMVCPANGRNAAALRTRLTWLRPETLGLRPSVGMGDRLGLATPGHVRALRSSGTGMAPIFAQQSIREMERTGRSARQVMDDATWGVFSEGWREGFGADADHLKTTGDVELCLEAGYTFFTFDPGEHVDDDAENAGASELRVKAETLPWDGLEDTLADMRGRYLDRTFDFEGHKVAFDEEALHRAAAKYGHAVAHAAALYRHLSQAAGERDFEVEISVDETASPTTHAQHVYIATELRRLGVRWVSLAPRYDGRFEKGVDYVGDVGEFEASLAVHAAIARSEEPYKLSLHSGSDKFSIYPAVARQTQGLVHLKTAGTSYLEALRVVAALDVELFREVYAYARERYEEEKASYHVSASLEQAPELRRVDDGGLPGLLEEPDARQVLHVTFGSVLRARSDDGSPLFQDRIMALLEAEGEAYASGLEAHFLRHLKPFGGRDAG